MSRAAFDELRRRMASTTHSDDADAVVVPEPTWLPVGALDAAREPLRRLVSHGGDTAHDGDTAPATGHGAIAPVLRRSSQSGIAATPSSAAATTGAGSGRQVLRRKISASSADIAATRRGKSGLKRLAGTKDGLDKIGKLLDLHRTKSDQQDQMVTLGAIIGLTRDWLAKHIDPKDAPTRALLEDILAEASRDLGQARAQQRYVNDMRAGDMLPEKQIRLAHEATATPFTQHLNVSIAAKANNASLNAAPGKTHAANSPAQARTEMIRAAGLSEAEILAIKKYTGSEYLFINPSIAQDSDWLGKQVPSMQGILDKQSRFVGERTVNVDAMRSEGVVHAGVAMQGLAKMEVKKGMTYRGARMTPEKFDETYGKKTHVVYKGFTSTGLEERTADGYARGGGERSPDPDQTVSVKCFFEVNDARDIKTISEINSENEWLLLPGASFEITRIDDLGHGDAGEEGRTPATAWKEVHLKQVSPKDVPPEKPQAPAVPASMQKLASGDFSVPAAARPRPAPALPRPTLGPSSALAMQNLARGKFQR